MRLFNVHISTKKKKYDEQHTNYDYTELSIQLHSYIIFENKQIKPTKITYYVFIALDLLFFRTLF